MKLREIALWALIAVLLAALILWFAAPEVVLLAIVGLQNLNLFVEPN